jgi:hypothetical protein
MVVLENLQETSTLEVIGTLIDIIGTEGKLFVSPSNLAGTKKVVLTLQLPDGRKGNIFCSTAVSKHLRAKTMTTSQLLGMPVVETETADKEAKIYLVTLPGAALQEITTTEVVPWNAEKVALEDLVDLS